MPVSFAGSRRPGRRPKPSSCRRSWRFRSPSTSVSFPAPDGPDTTNNRPGPVGTLLLLAVQTQPTMTFAGERPKPSVNRRPGDGHRLDPDPARGAPNWSANCAAAGSPMRACSTTGASASASPAGEVAATSCWPIDIFGSPPLVTLERRRSRASPAIPAGRARSRRPLRGLRVGEVRSRPGDRVLGPRFRHDLALRRRAGRQAGRSN